MANRRDSVSMFTVGRAFFSLKTPACWSPLFRRAPRPQCPQCPSSSLLAAFPLPLCLLSMCSSRHAAVLCILSSEHGQAAICFPSSLTAFFAGKQTACNFCSIPESSFQYHTPKIHLLESIRFCLFFKVWSLWLKFCVSCRFLPFMLTP